MKPASFDYVRASTVDEAVAGLKLGGASAKAIAGGQSLGPMLNLRLARPSVLVDVADIPEMRHFEDRGSRRFVGAAVTHAEIEDGLLQEAAGGLMQAVAGSIAYRAVRNRGTIGGSLAHADPAADWLLALTALDATVLIAGSAGRRAVPLGSFVISAFTSVLAEDEIVVGIEAAKTSPGARQVHRKFCRKVGKFAEASAAIVVDPASGIGRVVVGRTDGAPLLLPSLGEMLLRSMDTPIPDGAAAEALEHEAGPSDGYERHLQLTNLTRALAQVTNP